MRRLPARDSRCRCWSPDEASSGAVPFQEAKCPRLAKRWMSPTSPMRRAAPDGPMPLRFCRLLPVASTSSVSSLFAALIFLSTWTSSLISSEASRRRVRLRVYRVALSALTAGEHSGLGGQLRRHVDHDFAIGDKPLGDVPANAVAPLDRPDSLRIPPAQSEHRLVAAAISAEPAASQHSLPAVDDLDRRRPLVRVHPDDDLSHQRFSSRKPG